MDGFLILRTEAKVQGPSFVSVSKVLSSHHWGMGKEKKKEAVQRLEMLPLPGLVSETRLETGQSWGQMDTFPAQLHSARILSSFTSPMHTNCWPCSLSTGPTALFSGLMKTG